MSRFTPKEIARLAKHGSKGYLLEVDVKYPEELHDSHNELPFMCEKMKINGIEKLVPNLYDKKEICDSHKSIRPSPQTGINPMSRRAFFEF